MQLIKWRVVARICVMAFTYLLIYEQAKRLAAKIITVLCLLSLSSERHRLGIPSINNSAPLNLNRVEYLSSSSLFIQLKAIDSVKQELKAILSDKQWICCNKLSVFILFNRNVVEIQNKCPTVLKTLFTKSKCGQSIRCILDECPWRWC